MSVEMPTAEVRSLAARLSAAAEEADDAGARLSGAADVGAPLQSAVESFLDCQRAGARAMAGELRWLGGTIASVADAWMELDATLLARPADGGVP